jgi:hypothetical protein
MNKTFLPHFNKERKEEVKKYKEFLIELEQGLWPKIISELYSGKAGAMLSPERGWLCAIEIIKPGKSCHFNNKTKQGLLSFDFKVVETNKKLKSLPYKDGDIVIDKICMSLFLYKISTAIDYYTKKGKGVSEKVFIEMPSMYPDRNSRERELWSKIHSLVI